MIKFLIPALLTLTILIAGCSKKPKPATVSENKAAPVPAMTAEDSAKALQAREDSLKNAAIRADAIENERLEGQRKNLEDLMNRLMSEEIYFEFDKAILTDKAKDLLSQAGDILAKEPKLWVEVEGHTDARGTEAYNLSLGGKRAQSVVEYLVNYGVATDRLKSVSFGEEKPKVAGASEEDFAKNRRAAFNVKIKK